MVLFYRKKYSSPLSESQSAAAEERPCRMLEIRSAKCEYAQKTLVFLASGAIDFVEKV